ncbi:hypothetical protein ACFQZJ_01955 [Maribacter chungangensis]|uniref:Uncharacterized protein n=1 Tax=Maribacter chungangensis TaxID=1069117 RepID=A0ABW3AZL1_9FLAO
MTKTPKHEKTRDSFSVFTTTVEVEVGQTRPLTLEEMRYVRKSNWVRILALLDYVSYLAIVFSILFGLWLLIGIFLGTLISSPLLSGLVRFGIPLLLSLGFIALTWKRYPKRTKIWLSLKHLEAVELSGQLGIQIDPVGHTEKVYKLNNTHFQIPPHWQPYIYPIFKDEELLPKLSLWAVRRKDASNTAFSYLYRIRNIGTKMSRFQDYQYQALSCGPLSVKEDVRQGLPLVRGHHFWLAFAFVAAIVGVFGSIYLSTQLENNNKEVQALENTVMHLEAELNLGQAINAEMLAERGLPLFTEDSTYGHQVLRPTEPFDYVDVSFGHNNRPFLLTVEEYKIIMRVSQVQPGVLLGHKPASAKILEDYRMAIIGAIAKSTDVSEASREKAKASLLGVDNATLEQQIRSYGDRFQPDVAFASHFLPIPFIYMPEDRMNALRNCGDRHLFCLRPKNQKPMDTQDMALINTNKAQHNKAPSFEIVHVRKLAKIAERKKQRDAMSYIAPVDFWTQDKGVVGILLFVIAVVIFASFFFANGQIKKYYRQKLAM